MEIILYIYGATILFAVLYIAFRKVIKSFQQYILVNDAIEHLKANQFYIKMGLYETKEFVLQPMNSTLLMEKNNGLFVNLALKLHT